MIPAVVSAFRTTSNIPMLSPVDMTLKTKNRVSWLMMRGNNMYENILTHRVAYVNRALLDSTVYPSNESFEG